MKRMVVLGSAAAGMVLLAACGGGQRRHVVAAASEAERAVLLDQVKALAGTWEMTDEQGNATVASVFTVSSGGNVVREVMFPGTPHEMTNVYHMDGPTLVMTHYCAVGNQPRMRAEAGEAGTIVLKFDSVTNLTDAGQMYMGELTLEIKDARTVSAAWKSFKNGVEQADHGPVFTMRRRGH